LIPESTGAGGSEVDPSRPSLPNEVAVKPHLGRWISWVVLVAIVYLVLDTLLENPNIDGSVIRQYLFNSLIIDGVKWTVILAVVSLVVAILIGLLVGYGRISANPVARTAAWLWVWFFRSIPLIVFILIFGNLALFLPNLRLGIPFTHVFLFSESTNKVMIPTVAGATALSLEQSAYFAEIVRGGIQSVPDSQREAAAALGLSRWGTQRKVVLPQAIPVMIPPAGSSFVILLKSTSMVYAISGTELLSRSEDIAAANLKTMELLFVASAWYLVLTSIASFGQRLLERYFSRHRRRVQGVVDADEARPMANTPNPADI